MCICTLHSSVHYKEYLVNIINTHCLDPVTVYDTKMIKLVLIREEIAAPEQEDDEDDQQYRERLIQVECSVSQCLYTYAWGIVK